MSKFTPIVSQYVSMPVDNIDTDQIIPARFLKTISKDGLGDQLFNDWRYESDGSPKPDFILNQAESKTRQILLAGVRARVSLHYPPLNPRARWDATCGRA